MKKIYWIDDNLDYINNYIQGVMKELWGDEKEQGVASVIRIFGDGYKESCKEESWKQEDIETLIEEIQNNMISHCLDMEAWNWNVDNRLYQEKERLIKDVPILVEMEGDMASLIKYWKDRSKQTGYKLKNEEFTVEKIREVFHIPVGASVAIDLVLLQGDKDRVSKDIPIISMLLYDKLTRAGHKCILYSTFMYDSLFIDEWKRIYNNSKDEDVPEVETIYPGRQMWEKVKNSKIVEQLKQIAKESE